MNTRTIGLGLGAFSLGAVAVLAGLAFGRGKGRPGGVTLAQGLAGKLPASVTNRLPASTGMVEGHVPTDLVAGTDLGPDHRAPEAFRPDINASMTPAEREALRPATGPAPSLVAERGSGFNAAGAA